MRLDTNGLRNMFGTSLLFSSPLLSSPLPSSPLLFLLSSFSYHLFRLFWSRTAGNASLSLISSSYHSSTKSFIALPPQPSNSTFSSMPLPPPLPSSLPSPSLPFSFFILMGILRVPLHEKITTLSPQSVQVFLMLSVPEHVQKVEFKAPFNGGTTFHLSPLSSLLSLFLPPLFHPRPSSPSFFSNNEFSCLRPPLKHHAPLLPRHLQ